MVRPLAGDVLDGLLFGRDIRIFSLSFESGDLERLGEHLLNNARRITSFWLDRCEFPDSNTAEFIPAFNIFLSGLKACRETITEIELSGLHDVPAELQVQLLCEVFSFPVLEKLRILCINVHEVGIEHVVHLLSRESSKLKQLTLFQAILNDDDLSELSVAVKSSTMITHLNLEGNQFRSLIPLKNAVVRHPSLLVLSLEDNEDAQLEFVNFLAYNEKLQDLHLGHVEDIQVYRRILDGLRFNDRCKCISISASSSRTDILEVRDQINSVTGRNADLGRGEANGRAEEVRANRLERLKQWRDRAGSIDNPRITAQAIVRAHKIVHMTGPSVLFSVLQGTVSHWPALLQCERDVTDSE